MTYHSEWSPEGGPRIVLLGASTELPRPRDTASTCCLAWHHRETSRNFLGNPTKLPKCWISFREIGYSPFSDTPTCCQMMRKSVIVVSLIGSNHYHQPSLKAKLCLSFQISPTIIYLSFTESACFILKKNPGHKAPRRASTSDCRGMNFYISWKSITYTPGKKHHWGFSEFFGTRMYRAPQNHWSPSENRAIGIITHDVPWAPFWAVLLSLISRSTRLEKWAACTVKHITLAVQDLDIEFDQPPQDQQSEFIWLNQPIGIFAQQLSLGPSVCVSPVWQ